MTVVRGLITSVTEGEIKRFAATGRYNETFLDREMFQHYGFTSRPAAGAEALILAEGNNIYIIATDDRRYRIAVEEGETCIYTDEGDQIRLKRNKEIYIKSGDKLTAEIENEIDVTTKKAVVNASESVIVTSPEVTIVASTKVTMTTPLLDVSGNIRVGGGITGGLGTGGGDIRTSGDVYDGTRSMAADRGIYNEHTHNETQSVTGAPNQTE